MYKVFIDNTPVYFVESEKDLPKKCLALEYNPKVDYADFFLNHSKDLGNKYSFGFISNNPETLLLSVFSGIIYIEASGGLVKNTITGKYLFIKRNGFWDIPKGKLDEGEKPKAAGVREVEEECGISGPKITSHLVNTFHTYTSKHGTFLKKTYWYNMDYSGTDKLIAQKEEGITKVKWVKKDSKKWKKIYNSTFESIKDVMDGLQEN